MSIPLSWIRDWLEPLSKKVALEIEADGPGLRIHGEAQAPAREAHPMHLLPASRTMIIVMARVSQTRPGAVTIR